MVNPDIRMNKLCVNFTVLIYNLVLYFRDTNPRIADIFIKKGPFLKLYTSYIREFESMNSTLADARRRYPNFDALVKEFEVSLVTKNNFKNTYFPGSVWGLRFLENRII